MYSQTIKFVFALSGLSPILLTLWIVSIVQNSKTLNIYSPFGSARNIFNGTKDFLLTNWELLTFILIIMFTNFIIKNAIKNLPVRGINIKSIKPADINFYSVLVSFFLPWLKLFVSNDLNMLCLVVTLIISFITAYITMNSYHYNLIVRIFLGFKNYEVQTSGEVTYLLLSKTKLINKNQIKQYIPLSDHMLVNVS